MLKNNFNNYAICLTERSGATEKSDQKEIYFNKRLLILS